MCYQPMIGSVSMRSGIVVVVLAHTSYHLAVFRICLILAVVFAHTAVFKLVVLVCAVAHLSQSLVFGHAFVRVFHAPDLLDVYSALHQLSDNLGLRSARFVLF